VRRVSLNRDAGCGWCIATVRRGSGARRETLQIVAKRLNGISAADIGASQSRLSMSTATKARNAMPLASQTGEATDAPATGTTRHPAAVTACWMHLQIAQSVSPIEWIRDMLRSVVRQR